MTFSFGIDQLLAEQTKLEELKTQKVALLAHPASMTSTLEHSLDALIHAGLPIVKAFGPQHGMRGDKQDNMIETEDFLDPIHNIPIISLYGEHRKPTTEMLEDVDVVLFDLQDVGCRIYTYITTLRYFLEQTKARVIVLDRPNPAGRQLDGLALEDNQESFVGAYEIPTRHGLTVGELAKWYVTTMKLPVALEVIYMQGYDVDNSPWPQQRSWVNPSPNAASPNMAQIFPGTVLLEGTNLSEGRGTTIPLEVIGAPDFPAQEILTLLKNEAPDWIEGAGLRICNFEPTFHKHVGELCHAIQIHTDNEFYQPEQFKPYRFIAGCLKALKILRPDYDLWRHHEYEYELDRIPIDVINGGPKLRTWVDDPDQSFDAFNQQVQQDVERWAEDRKPFLHYR